MTIDLTFGGRVRLPLITAPMFLVSTPELALAACSAGVIGSFPAHGTRTRDDFERWLQQMESGIQVMRDKGLNPAPYAVNLVVHPSNKRYPGDLALCEKYKVELILTSKGAPNDAFDRIHQYGGLAFHDVATKRHAEKALKAGADGIIAVCTGAGGHTGQQNPFALVHEIRQLTDKPIILAGALGTGQDILAAQVMGADMAYMGTRFIACKESLAADDYCEMLLQSQATDVFETSALDGFPASFLIPSLRNTGLDIEQLKRMLPGDKINADTVKKRYAGIWASGQGCSKVTTRESAVTVCEQLTCEYQTAKQRVMTALV
ncbi:nitronate monooxygenase family protein [Maricurvus nonylphenolicus]|uniref:NAD(P)H-dependent flavin oxidoreductase n=1 Tax=Maricurvus nonylphenolicus TaxID=1008307 RepID=UPI0036F3E00F